MFDINYIRCDITLYVAGFQRHSLYLNVISYSRVG